ncbi:MAG: hypothetical protein QGG54_16225, partial [Gammaproteobacteria bacterium]|nr:hypothetical protein [Gammaproteobacteria bacterium]
ISGLNLLILPLAALLITILMPALASARGHARTAVSMDNMRRLCTAVIIYAAAHNSELPDPDNWKQQLEPYLNGDPDQVLRSPFEREAGCGFAMNRLLDGSLMSGSFRTRSKEVRYPSRTVLFFEVESDSSPAGGPELLPEEPLGPRGYVIGFVDGHVETVEREDLEDLEWAPDGKDVYEFEHKDED